MATLYCLPSDILSYGATWSLTAGTINSAFPLANLNNTRVDLVAKLNETSGTFRGTISSTALEAVAVFNCNRRGSDITVTNGGAMASQSLPISTTFPAGSPGINGWKDLRAVTAASTAWDFAFPATTGNVAVGKILLITTLRTMPIRLSAQMREIRKHRVERTGYGVAIGGKKNMRCRELTARLSRESYRSDYSALRRASSGPLEPFFLVLEEGVNDPMYVWFPMEDWAHSRELPEITEWTDMLEELNSGTAL